MSKNVYMGHKKADRRTVIAAEASLSRQIAEQLLWDT